MVTRGWIATASRIAGQGWRIVSNFTTEARPKPDDEFQRKMKLFLIVVIAALAMVMVRKLMG
jgi:hypothetical protein